MTSVFSKILDKTLGANPSCFR